MHRHASPAVAFCSGRTRRAPRPHAKRASEPADCSLKWAGDSAGHSQKMENCICPGCVSACRNDPGRLVPDDVRKLSRLLGISERDLENDYLVRVSVASGGHTLHALAPAKRKGRRFVAAPGTAAPDYYAKEDGRCIFLDDNDRCSVHEAKPFECGAYMGCRDTFLGRPYRTKTVEEFFHRRWRQRK